MAVFLFEHAPVREDCVSCHEPHGSNHKRLLVNKLPNLCWNCHLTGSGHFGSGDNLSTEKGVPVAPGVPPAMAELVREHRLDHHRGQCGISRRLGQWRAAGSAHRQDQLAAAGDEGSGQRRLAGVGLGLHHDVQGQPLVAGLCEDRMRGLEPRTLGCGEGGDGRRLQAMGITSRPIAAASARGAC
jgi:predicted CXXCH cytochrome family protein